MPLQPCRFFLWRVTKIARGMVMWGLCRVIAVMFPLAALIAGGCTESFFPVSGPNSVAIRSGNSDAGQQYAQVRLTPQVVNILDEYGPLKIAHNFSEKRPPPVEKIR